MKKIQKAQKKSKDILNEKTNNNNYELKSIVKNKFSKRKNTFISNSSISDQTTVDCKIDFNAINNINYDSEKSNLNDMNMNNINNYKEKNFEIVEKEHVKIIYFNKFSGATKQNIIVNNSENIPKIQEDDYNNNNYFNRNPGILSLQYSEFNHNNNNYINDNNKNLINSNLNQIYINNNYNNSLNGLNFSYLNRNFNTIRNQIYTNLNPIYNLYNNNYLCSQNYLMNNHIDNSPDFIKYNNYVMKNIERNLILNNLNKSLLMDLLKEGN